MTQSRPRSVTNFYDLLPADLQPKKRTYPNEAWLGMPLPFHHSITGGTGAGKTNQLFDLIKNVGVFDRFYLYAKKLDEPLYANFIRKMRKIEQEDPLNPLEILTISNDIADLVDVSQLDPRKNNLLIVDDMITESSKMLSKVVEHFTRGRKENESCVWIGQGYFPTPKLLRGQCETFSLSKIGNDRDFHLIAQEFGDDGNKLRRLYKEATREGFPNFFMIDTLNPEKRFRKNWDPMLGHQHDGQDEDEKEIVPAPRKRKAKREVDFEPSLSKRERTN